MFYPFIILCLIPVIGCADLWYRNVDTPNPYLKVISVDIKHYPLKYPGNVVFTPSFEVLKDIPIEDAKLSASLDKLTPKRMRIPCINGFGSCTVNYCEDYDKNFLLSAFGFGKCPMKKGQFTVHHPSTPMPNFGDVFNKIMEGDFEANITYFNGKTNQIYNSFQIKLSIELSK